MWNKKSTLPELLRFTDPGIREQLAALPASQILIGIGPDGQPVCVDLDVESPHVLVCSGSGGGTTSTLRTLTAQLLHHGGHALVLDTKRISQQWARALPTVTYRTNLADIHDALVGLQAELKRRIDHTDQDGDTDDLPRLTVVFEAADHTLHKLARYWDTVREKGDPKTSPAVDALHELLFVGREARIHVFYHGHALNSALGLGGHEQFSTVLLGRVTTRTWDRLAPQIDSAPKSSSHPGRVHVVQGFTAHPTQVLLMTDAEAAAWVAATAAEEG
ncbi:MULTISPECIES: hypothetical protein [unclassified Streptomyces]|uniref:hypothetical protein n=1 Tax=unclassified Streptomyces TaxID=2593676 RepID=UPI0022571B31|nr:MULTISPECIES: hypothetical protein [unclassified Streptomyces]MCX4799445.1 hypothetical protein [Streptomyces sp. NBC_01242]WSP53119.1 hypothetical protein OG306_00665 [Streptomyces sp. NBC_01241]WSP67045.1 hypothetical protein OG466_38325 [Streptomyces sp. NBC_01240]WSU26164.1 hypothetical protein OG508_38360 [Streptomyces sp. NBC_01108]